MVEDVCLISYCIQKTYELLHDLSQIIIIVTLMIMSVFIIVFFSREIKLYDEFFKFPKNIDARK